MGEVNTTLSKIHARRRVVASPALAAESHDPPVLRVEERLPWPDRRRVAETNEVEGMNDEI